jgi:hypothetical protein
MANDKKNNPAPAAAEGGMVRPPEGFQRQGSASGAPWFKLEPGAVISGKLLGKFKRPDPKSPTKESFFFQVEVDQRCKATLGRGADAKIISVDPGSVVNLNYTKKTAEAYDHFIPQILAGAKVLIWAQAKSKMATMSGNSFWDIDCLAKMESPPASTGGDDEGDGPSFDESED